jgi:hypothetical protein
MLLLKNLYGRGYALLIQVKGYEVPPHVSVPFESSPLSERGQTSRAALEKRILRLHKDGTGISKIGEAPSVVLARSTRAD